MSESLFCQECGMLVRGQEYHPYAACLMFKGCHDAETVRANLPPYVDLRRAYDLQEERLRVAEEKCRKLEEAIADTLSRSVIHSSESGRQTENDRALLDLWEKWEEVGNE